MTECNICHTTLTRAVVKVKKADMVYWTCEKCCRCRLDTPLFAMWDKPIGNPEIEITDEFYQNPKNRVYLDYRNRVYSSDRRN